MNKKTPVTIKKQAKPLDLLIDTSFFLFLCSKTFLGNLTVLEYASLACFILLVFYRAITTHNFIIKSKYTFWYITFALFATASLTWSLSRDFALKALPSVGALAVFTIALVNYIKTKSDLYKLLKMYLVTNTIAGICIIVFFALFSGPAAERISNITGIYFNTIAQTMAFASIIGIYFTLLKKKPHCLILIAILMLAIILSESRKALLIPIIAGAVMLALKKKTKRERSAYIIIFLTFLISAVTLVSLNDGLRTEFIDLFSATLLQQETGDWSINLRNFFVNTGIRLWREYPILGSGLNNFAYYVQHFTTYDQARYAHNNYIELLSTLGAVGATLYYWIYIYIISRVIKKLRKERQLLTILGFVLISVLAIFEWGIVSYSGVMYNILIFIALFIAETKNSKKELKT